MNSKNFILILTFIFSSGAIDAQSKQIIKTWFYSLPVNKNASGLIKNLRQNSSFEEVTSSGTTGQHSISGFAGKILTQELPVEGKPDSGTIKLQVGEVNSTEGYSGKMKWLRVEYFSSDSVFLKNIFEIAYNNLLAEVKEEEKNTGFRDKDNYVVGEGKKFIFVNQRDQVRSISILRNRFKSGKQSFSIHYSMSGS